MIKLINSKRKGFTLIEILIALSILGIIAVAIASKMGTGGDVWETENEHTELMQNAIVGLDKITRELKQAYEITAISGPGNANGFVNFKYVDGTSNSFRFNNGYIENGSSRLAGPVTELRFMCYDNTGDIQVKNLNGDNLDLPSDALKRIKLIDIQIETKKPNGNIRVPVSSKVSLGDDLDYIFTPFKFAIFGNRGVTISNQLWIGVHPSPRYPVVDAPANVGSFRQDALSLQNVKIFGDIIVYGNITFSNNSFVSGDVLCGSYVTVKQNCMVAGNIYTDSVKLENGSYAGRDIYYSLTGTFINNGSLTGIARRVSKPLPEFMFSKDPFPPWAPADTFYPSDDPSRDITDANDANKDGIIDLPLPPGQYRDISFKSDKTLNLDISVASEDIAVYHFRSINTKVLNLNIIGISEDKGIQIFVEGDINSSSFNMIINNQPPFNAGVYNENYNQWAKMVYVELGGTIGNPNFVKPSQSQGVKGTFIGTFFASRNPDEIPYPPLPGSIIIGDNTQGSSGMVVGALYARGLAGLANPGNNTSLNLPNERDNPNVVPDLIYVSPSPKVLPSKWSGFLPNN